MPDSPTASRSANRSSSASTKRPSTPSGKDCWPLATRRGRRRMVRKHTRPRTRTRPSDWWVASVTARPARAPRSNGRRGRKTFPRQRFSGEGRCASPDGQSAHRPPRVVSALQYGSKSERSRPSNPTPRVALPPRAGHTLSDAQTCFQPRDSASWLERRRASRSVSTVGRPTASTIPQPVIRFWRRSCRRRGPPQRCLRRPLRERPPGWLVPRYGG